jgi:hypothetical protein
MVAAGQDGGEIVPSIERAIAWTGTPDGSGNFTATLTSLTPGTKYYTEIEDQILTDPSNPYSPTVTAYGSGSATTTGSTAPAAPAWATAQPDPSATSSGKSAFVVNWQNSSANETAFEILQSIAGGAFSPVATVARDVAKYTAEIPARLLTGVVLFEVLAQNAGGQSAPAATQPTEPISVDLKLLKKGDGAIPTDDPAYANDLIESGGNTQLGPLPVGQGRHKKSGGTAAVYSLVDEGDISPAAANLDGVSFRLYRTVQEREWMFLDPTPGSWNVASRKVEGFGTGGPVPDGPEPALKISALRHLYNYDDPGIDTADFQGLAEGEIAYAEKQFTVWAEEKTGSGWTRISPKVSYYQEIQLTRVASNGNAADWRVDTDDVELGTVNCVMDVGKAASLTGADKDKINILPTANPNE